MTAFLKMHGLGNDFALFDARESRLSLDAAGARAIADRRTGIGCDQVIVIERANNGADAFMRIFNADGGEVEHCGNAARCVARLLMEEKDKPDVRLEIVGGTLECRDAGAAIVSVDMGAPKFGWRDIPLAKDVDTNAFDLTAEGATFQAAAVSIGNPHCLLFVDNADKAQVERFGPAIEHHLLFPERTNVEFVSVRDRAHLRMRVWERGAGITRACGTGACAAAVTAHRRGLADRKVDVLLDGGPLTIEWRASDDHILMTGPATLAYKGEIDLGRLERVR